ncbi:MAG: MarR family transcriptional regulator [Spirochaetes bacterium]|nr:MarR family transcriptional regulator [Spirochaetota bacterium]
MATTRLLDYIYWAHRFLSELESMPRDYGTGEALYASYIHTVVAVHKDPGCNLTNLARALGISKAAVSKLVAKLIQQGYLKKYKAVDNKRDVLFSVTTKGQTAVQGHEEFERITFEPLITAELALSPQDRSAIESYFKDLFSRLT